MKPLARIAATALCLALAASTAQAEARKLKGAEIAKFLSGRTLFSPPGKAQSAQHFDASGITLYQSADKQLQGRWKVVGDTYCSAWDDKSEPKCAEVFVEPPAVAFVGADGEKNILVMSK